MTSKPEENVQNAIRDWLVRELNVELIKTHGSAIRKGDPDLTGCLPYRSMGLYIAIEVKQPGKEPTEIQQVVLRRIRRRNGIAFWADSLESAQRQLHDELDRIDALLTGEHTSGIISM